jgi:hypothetical protein
VFDQKYDNRGGIVAYLEDLRDMISQVHGADATHVESVPVKKTFHGKTVWEGVVEVFDLIGHPAAFRAYAWTQPTDDPSNPLRHITMLHLHPIKSAQDAVNAALIHDVRNLEPEPLSEESRTANAAEGEAKGRIVNTLHRRRSEGNCGGSES